MARPSNCSPLPCVINRQIDDRVDHCKRLVNARLNDSRNLFRKDLLSHYGCVNAIEFSSQGDLLISGGDDRRVLLWKVEQAIQDIGKPAIMRAQHDSNIFCLGYDSSKTKIFSAGNDDQVIVHDLRNGDPLNYFLHEKPVYGLSIHPHNDNVFASACDDGRVLIYDIRGTSTNESFCLAQYKTAFHSVMYNPLEPRMLATANSKEGVSMWDVRKPLEPVMRYGSEGPPRSCMYVRFNKDGNRLLALRRRLPPVLYSTDSPTHLCQFDHPGYYNSCTMKSCCFAGNDDEYVLSGSDDFKLYMWKIPKDDIKWVDSAHMILQGHRSIVNQVRYNEASCILASSGVEKMIKIWSPFTLGYGCLGGLKKDHGKQEKQRRIYTHDEYVRLVIHSGEFMSHDYSHESTREDSRMMAFFDSLVQREIQDWSSDDLVTPKTSSESDAQSPTDHVTIISDSDEDSTTSQQHSTIHNNFQQHMMMNILGSRVNSSGNLSAQKRSKKSPNIITRLIASHRGKLMKLAALENGEHVVNGRNSSAKTAVATKTVATPPAVDQSRSSPDVVSDSETEPEMASPRGHKHKPKCKSKSSPPSLKRTKRKHADNQKLRMRGKRKANSMLASSPVQSSSASSDSDSKTSNGSELRDNEEEGDYAVLPSTSSGLSWRHMFGVRSSDSSSESEDEDVSSSSDSEPRKNSARHRQKKRGKGNGSATNYKSNKCRGPANEIPNEENAVETRNGTPPKRRKLALTSDSGITSEVSTAEKSTASGARCSESPERENARRQYQMRKIEAACKSYRKRSLVASDSSDSSD